MKDVLAAGSHPQVVAAARPKPIQRQEPRASSRSPLQVQGPKAQGHPLLLSQATSWELKGKSITMTISGTHMIPPPMRGKQFSD